MNKKFLPSLLLVICLLVLLTAFTKLGSTFKYQPVLQQSDYHTVEIGGQDVSVSLATKSSEWERGLSGTLPLTENTGMLFIFPAPDYYKFWMKEMTYPIDIVWINANKQIVFMKEHATPESYPELFSPREKALYVLEVPDGFVSLHGVEVADTVIFK